MDIIPFPITGSVKVSSPEHLLKMHLGPVRFTCPCCSTSSELTFSKMIFRVIEFYCEECGNPYKIVNPAFSPPIPPPKPKKK